MKIFVFLAIFFSYFTCTFSQEIHVVKIEELKKVYMQQNDTTYVINFFATWCGPCKMELPVLNNFYEEHKNTSTQLIFVSLDNSQYLKKLPSFIKKAKMQAPVYLLNESADFSWLPLIDQRWQGSIPATMIVNSKRHIKGFFETPMEKGQLEFYLKKLGL
jgi:thiol-disulfide isomerase/thioredoxin